MMAENWEDEDIYTCPICKRDDCVPPYGKKDSPVLIVGDAPGDDELKTGRPFSGATGKVFRIELARLGMDMYSFRICNVWQHKATNDEHSEQCYELGFKKVIEEAKGRKVILLVGADVVKKFTGMHVSEVTGLQVTSPYLSAPLIVACLQPTVVFHDVVGDFRLSLQKFAQKAKRYL